MDQTLLMDGHREEEFPTRRTSAARYARRLSRAKTHLVVLFLAIFAAAHAEARDLKGRLGLGYNAEWVNTSLTNGVPALSLKYGLSRDLAVEGIFGIATTSPGNSVTALKLFKNVFFEQNLNFYFAVGGGILTANSKTGSEFIATFGTEFFIPGVDSLGFSMEMGASLDNMGDNFVVKTLGISFLNAGMHFYF